jgi:hypothetical protein
MPLYDTRSERDQQRSRSVTYEAFVGPLRGRDHPGIVERIQPLAAVKTGFTCWQSDLAYGIP